jgi:Outer membrane protein beta-barrel domain
MKFNVLALILISLVATAQIEVGLKAGVSLTGQNAKQTGPGVDTGIDMYEMANAKSITALNGGFYIELKRSPNFSIQPEIIFKGGGYKRSFDYASGFSYKEKFKISYIDIPVLARYNVTINEQLSVFLLGGPYVGFWVSAHRILDQDGEKEYETRRSYFSEIRKDAELGAVLAGGVKYRTPFGKFSLELRAIKSFTNIYLPQYDYNATGGTYSVGLQLSYIYTLNELFGPQTK